MTEGGRDEHARYATRVQRLRNAVSRGQRLTPSSSAAQIEKAIVNDRYLEAAYAEQYGALRRMIPHGIEGPIVEIGAGSGVGKTWIPELICTDILAAPGLDGVVDATRLPFADSSVRALVLKDALHHVPDVPQFLNEAVRTLRPGGAIVLCEPYWGAAASLVYRTVHPEPFDKEQIGWAFTSIDAWDSNQAMAWILLRRDSRLLAEGWPELRVEENGPLLGPSYLLSGGVFGRTPIPSAWLLALHRRERRCARWLDPIRFEYAFRLVRIP